MSKESKILIVEDDKFLARIYKLKLKSSDWEVQLAGDGEEALSILKDFQPDIILLDLILPKIDGFDVLKKVKEDDKTKKIPVIILSNLGQDTDIKRGMELGAIDYIVKTNTTIEDVIAKTKKVLSSQK